MSKFPSLGVGTLRVCKGPLSAGAARTVMARTVEGLGVRHFQTWMSIEGLQLQRLWHIRKAHKEF